MKQIFIITGQTATGKTKHALELATKHNGELINCDSRQIYKQLDIITGKDIEPNAHFTEVRRIDQYSIGFYELSSPIWLYDIVDPKHSFSSFDYQTCAIEVMKDIFARGKTPIIVGGTYLYIKHLLYDVETEHIQPNWSLRSELAHKTVKELQILLAEQNPRFFALLNESDRNNPQRLIRKIEIIQANPEAQVRAEYPAHITQKLAHSLQLDPLELKITFLGFTAQKEHLIESITHRVEKRMEQGALEEVKNLLSQGYSEKDAGLQTIGYRQLIEHLDGFKDLPTALQEWVTKEIQYAKRQLTFMKKDPFIRWK